ncbi:histone deacetylase 15-like [Papaver somniferum]|nr:histone deacetylase 15-like [Papaver somniferum]XP_026380865.1 histone deacetylase 15-like [Papaver somniferum]XP_026380866.1 histone deacetylase 15-like [Papaver somniferum]XP_026380867.1 histone deacetylase 15-like [Papaver somniferum]XP_026380868.1 histone deacetylase 15-like [Papaver somniferum]
MSAKKILILDWDVHHGNGTQEIFDADRSVLYISIHRFDRGKFYPPTGAADKVGVKGAKGYSVNIPWNRAGVGDCDYLSAFKHIVIPIARQFSPELTIVSAGFDAARGDPLGLCDVTPRYYAEMTSMLASICGKLLVILEGGYNLRSISASAKAVVEVLLGGDPAGVRKLEPSISGLETIREVLRHPK